MIIFDHTYQRLLQPSNLCNYIFQITDKITSDFKSLNFYTNNTHFYSSYNLSNNLRFISKFPFKTIFMTCKST